MQPVLKSPRMNQLTGFGQVTAIHMLQHFFSSYGAIDEIDLKENAVNMMGPYDPAEPFTLCIDQFTNGREFSITGGKLIQL